MSVVNTGLPARYALSGWLVNTLQNVKTEAMVGRPRFWASDVGYCPRKAVGLLHLPERYINVSTAASELYKAIGSGIHEAVQSMLETQGILLEAERHIEGKLVNVGGYIDALVLHEGKEWIVEIKSCGKLPTKPHVQHARQAGVYSWITGIDNVMILYVSRSVANYNGTLTAIEFEIDSSHKVHAMKSMATAHVYEEQKTLPRIPAHISSQSKCRYCALKSYCWQNADVDFVDLKTRVTKKEHETIMEDVKAFYHKM